MSILKREVVNKTSKYKSYHYNFDISNINIEDLTFEDNNMVLSLKNPKSMQFLSPCNKKEKNKILMQKKI